MNSLRPLESSQRMTFKEKGKNSKDKMGSHGTLIFFEVSKKFTVALTPLERE